MLIPLFLFIVFFTIIIVIIKAKTFDVDVKQQMDPAQVSSNKVRYIIYWLILAKKGLKENEQMKLKFRQPQFE